MLPREHYLKQPFNDPIHFPDGFEKGGLSDIQARLIRKHGTLIKALGADEVSDASPDDLHILKVVANQSAPKNPVEQAWMKYLATVKNLETNASGKNKAAKPKTVKTKVEATVVAVEAVVAAAETRFVAEKAVSAKVKKEEPPLKVKSTADVKVKPEIIKPSKSVEKDKTASAKAKDLTKTKVVAAKPAAPKAEVTKAIATKSVATKSAKVSVEKVPVKKTAEKAVVEKKPAAKKSAEKKSPAKTPTKK